MKTGKKNWGISSDTVVVFARSISVFNVTEFDIFESVVVTTFAAVLDLPALTVRGMYWPT